ncbi:uncharacterized protein LOC130436759 [Triplophysa dalaica]|uniref:uncharacterized protein LOC130436750 n=1 Tax=Triplophysa dalaica TaxID=1582913 RepID=UPI0024DFE28D|nr:uncharacterized protein LOC130436750 [Triplophysa dalaica]XP_056623680.1 uncharacterized protein LOC130436759 [Triplophysa dalaica]
MPILHRCLSHIMKNAKIFCKKHSPKNYRLSMHVFGLLTSASTLKEMEDILISMAVVFSSPKSGENVEKHFLNLQHKMQKIGISENMTEQAEEHLSTEELDMGETPFQRHFENIIAEAPVHDEGGANEYHSTTFMPNLVKYFLPHAPLWSALMLGDLGRHGKGCAYENLSKKFERCSHLDTQNYTNDNKTQGIMEKSQWDLKHVRLQRRRLTRLDDFVHVYQATHYALLKEFSDSNHKKKTHRVDVERWKQRRQSKKGIYVTPLLKVFPFKKAQQQPSVPSKTSKPKAANKKTNICRQNTTAVEGYDSLTEEKAQPENLFDDTKVSGIASPTEPIKTTPAKGRDVMTVMDADDTSHKKNEKQIQSADTKAKKKQEKVKNLGPCWQDKNPTEKLPTFRLCRPQQAPKGSALSSILHPQHWLTSDEVDLASYLMARDYTEIDGFQSTLLFSALETGGVVGTPTRPFVQILHIGGSHWVTASNLFAGNNEVFIYDSLSTVLNSSTKQVLSWLLRPKEDQFIIKCPPVQQQSNSSNCGPFAIGFAYVLCCNMRPENCQFREGRMRDCTPQRSNGAVFKVP